MAGPVLIPAAGHSIRMGRPKLLLPLGGQTILERLVTAARLGSVTCAVVVVRPDDTELADVAQQAGADVVRLPAATPDMRATVLAGLEWIEARVPPAERPGFYLIPADHPVVSPAVFRALVATRLPSPPVLRGRGESTSTIIVPTHAGRRGHPVWIAWPHVAALRQIPEGQGLNTYLRSQQAVTTDLPWPTPDILIDLDTQTDYDRLVQEHARRPTLISSIGEHHHDPTHRPIALLPGSFNPVHAGHWGLADAAREILGAEVHFELSRHNVDKPELSDAEVARRSSQFRGRADLWITYAPRFVDKASHFPGVVFVVGADTAARLVDVRYYEGDAARLAAALESLLERECRFLVAARSVGQTALLTLHDLPIPERWRPLFTAIPVPRFRLDISSTDVRREGPP